MVRPLHPRSSRAAPPPTAAAAASMRMLAVLLQAGASPASAWQHLADNGDEGAQRVVRRCEDGASLVSAIAAEGGAWRDAAAAWEIAVVVGAPLADVLRAVADALRDAAEASDDVRVALAEPAGTARLLLWMPPAGLLLGFALGFDTLTVITTQPIGIACVAIGLLLVLLARLWTRRLVRAAQPSPRTPGIRTELMAVALSGGVAIVRARRLVDDAWADAERGPDAERESDDDADGIDAVLALSRSAGVPAVELLRASAVQQRHDARVAGRVRAARLSTKLLIPLGVCTLPAFLLLGVAPLLLSVLTTTPLPFG